VLNRITEIEKSNFQSAVSSQFLLRVGGLPINVVDDLRFEKTAKYGETLLSLEYLLVERKERLVDALHEAVNAHKEDQKLRRKLIDLKRDVFNLRTPNRANIEATRLLAQSLSSQGQVLLEEWLDLWERHQEELTHITETFTQELYQKRALLKEIISIPDFRKGLLLSSYLLDQAIDGYITSDNQQLNREARTVERSLFEYLIRTACKTSPFSTLTSVCTGVFDDLEKESDQYITYRVEDMEKRSFTKINIAVLSRLSSLILSCNEIRKELPIQMTPGWRVQKNRIRYLRRRQNIDDANEDAPMDFYSIHENIFYLPLGQLLQDLLKLMGDGSEMKLGDVVFQLCNQYGREKSEEEVEIYLHHLLRLGLLIVPSLQVNIHSSTPLTEYRKSILCIVAEPISKLSAHLERIELLVNSYATASLCIRRELLTEIKQQIKKCFSEIGGAEIPVPRTSVYEDTTLNPQKLIASREHWSSLLSNLAEFQQLLPIFDVNLPRKLVTKGYFRARYGKGKRHDDFLSFADEFNQEFFEHYLQGPANRNILNNDGRFIRHENSLNLLEIEMLDAARQVVADYMREAHANMPLGSSEVILGDDFIEAISPCMLEKWGEVQSHAFFSQFAYVDNQPLLVINRVYTGLTLMFSRFAHFFTQQEGHQLVPELRATLENLQPDGAVFAELKGGYEATNLNLHPQLTSYELVCPGDVSTRPKSEQIQLEDLYIQDDERANCLRLYSRSLSKEVIPLYLGFLLPMALPEIQQILLNFSYAPMCPLSLWLGAEVQSTGNKITSYPRVRYKNIVLHRQLWKIDSQGFPQRKNGQSDATFYLEVSRWRKENTLPSRVFVSPDTSTSVSSSEGKEGQSIKTYKPLYVDFDNYFSVSLLEATVRGTTGRLEIAEMLPSQEHLWLKHDEHSYVSEFVLEMNRIEGGSHE